MATTNKDLVTDFLNGAKKGTVNNLQIERRNGRTALINFSTVIAELMDDNVLHINKTGYGRTTTRIQNELIKQAQEQNMDTVSYHNIDMHTKCLV